MFKSTVSNFFCILFLVVLAISSFFTVKSFSGLYDKQVIVYTGQVVDKYTEEYACGKHNRKTCTKYMVQTTDSLLTVYPDAYNRATKIFPFVAYKTVLDRPLYATIFIWLWVPAMLGFCIISHRDEE